MDNDLFLVPYLSQTLSKYQSNSLQPNQSSIQDVLFFPQMRPEVRQKAQDERQKEEFMELGVPEEWVDPLHAMGYTTVEKLREVEKPGKLANDLNGYNKKNKLGLSGLSPEMMEDWLSS